MIFSFQLKKDAYEFSEIETKFIKTFLGILERHIPQHCSWITTSELEDVQFFWAPAMADPTNGIMGCWDPGTPNKCFLAAQQNQFNICRVGSKDAECKLGYYIKDQTSFSNCVSLFTSETLPLTMLHEFYHRWQFKTIPVLYIINRLVTVFIDNPLIEAIVRSIKQFINRNDPYYQSGDNNHLPWLYKLTLEYDADRSCDQNKDLINFVHDLTQAFFYYKMWVENKFMISKKDQRGIEKAEVDDSGEYTNTMYQCAVSELSVYDQKVIDYAKELFDVASDNVITEYKFIKK